MRDKDDNVIELFKKELPHINNTEGRITYNPHRLLTKKEKETTTDRLRRSLEKVNQLMRELRGDQND